jgi:radical SAM protein with 4Fe4S-binding SPASM domain
LEEIQNKQRGKYDNVCKTIDYLCEANLYIEVRSMITPLNVERMKEMVQTLITRFPFVNYYMFDPITDRHTFRDEVTTASFYEKYQYHFLEALELAEQHQKQLKCAPLRNLNSIVKRYCFGELCLTPEGTITICHRVSSSSDAHYNDCVYGKITESGEIEFDYAKYQHLINSDTVYDNPNCHNCFIKWNCGGGCMVQNKEYSNEIRSIICESTRNFSKKLLLRKLET